MDASTATATVSYNNLLEKIRIPQSSFQRLAVVSLFQRFRSAPPPLGLDSNAGRDALSRVLTSPSAAVTDQAVRELCRLVKDGFLDLSAGLLELQSGLDGCSPRFVPLFVKGIGFLTRFAFRRDVSWASHRFSSLEFHPFIKVLSSRSEAEEELVQQLLLFIVHEKSLGMKSILRFLRPILLFSLLNRPSSASSASFFKELISSIASVACSMSSEAINILKLLTSCLNYFPCSTDEEIKCLCSCAECLVDAFVVNSKNMVSKEMMIAEAQACTVDLLRILFSLCNGANHPQGIQSIIELAKRLLVAQKKLSPTYPSEFASVGVSISIILTQVELEHEQLSLLKLLIFLNRWKTENECNMKNFSYLSEELLYIFPVINLMSSPSVSVKTTAFDLLSRVNYLLKDLSANPAKATPIYHYLSISKLDSIVLRLLHHVWFQEHSCFKRSFLGHMSACESELKHGNKVVYWTDELRDYFSYYAKNKDRTMACSLEDRTADLSMLLSSVTSILLVHPKLGVSAASSLASIGAVDPKMGVSLLLAVLFFTNVLCSDQPNSSNLLITLMALIPSLASHAVMVPLVLQAIMPMLQKDGKPVLYAAAVRLLCQIWMNADWTFGTLQAILDPTLFSYFTSERDIVISLAASVRDVCRHKPERGIDIILSISSCIESQNSVVRALGLESLAYLCEADVVDFYTAWNVISEHLIDYFVDPIVAYGLCTFLRWGSTDAESYSEASKNIIHILWELGTVNRNKCEPLWTKVRKASFKSLSHFEVGQLQESLPEFKRNNLLRLLSEDDVEVLSAMEELELKIIKFDHMTRRRILKQKRTVVHKVEKLLDVLPRAIFSQGKPEVSELPGAALLNLTFSPKDFIDQGTSKDVHRLHAAYEKALLDVAESLYSSRNLLLALLILQSWKAFMHHWIQDLFLLANAKGSSTIDNSIVVASNVLKRLIKIGEESIPRVAVNVSLAIGALCMVVPTSAHEVISDASLFLLKCVSEYEHEHLQWSAAISLGVISSFSDALDINQKTEVVNRLLEVLHTSKSLLIKGASGVGLGFACQNLLKGVDISDYSDSGGTVKNMETMLIQNITITFCHMICQLCPSVSDVLFGLIDRFPFSDNAVGDLNVSLENYDDIEDGWGLAGIVIGMGSSVSTLYHIGAYDSVLKIEDILVSWIPAVGEYGHSQLFKEIAEISLCIGSCLILPNVVAFCQRHELVNFDFHDLFNRYSLLISELLKLRKTGALYENLLMASCIGAGSFISCIMTLGVDSPSLEDIENLLQILRTTYTQSYRPSICLGGMIGIVNAFGAGAGDLFEMYPWPMYLQINYKQDSSLVTSRLLSDPSCEILSTKIFQEMFLIAKESKDQQRKSYAAWAVSFLRHRWWSNESEHISTPSQNFDEESLVWTLCLWLKDNQYNKKNECVPAWKVASILKCLSEAPRLPAFEWGAIVRRCMIYETPSSRKAHVEHTFRSLREECIKFSSAHANQVSALLHFLDELSGLARFRTLELNLQLVIMEILPNLLIIFSSQRLNTLFHDLIEFFSSTSSPYLCYEAKEKRLLRISFWKGIDGCLAKNLDEPMAVSNLGKSISCLFLLLPVLDCDCIMKNPANLEAEWSIAIRCFASNSEACLVDALQVPFVDPCDGGSQTLTQKRIFFKTKLVRIGRIPASDLAVFKPQIFNANTEGMWWRVLIEVAAALMTAESGVKQQWLLDAIEISCVTKYPSTAIKFLGLFSSACCMYMPLITIDRLTVLSDLPVTLPSLLSENNWCGIASVVVEKLVTSTERMCAWVTGNKSVSSSTQDHINESEVDMLHLSRVMLQTCIYLKDYLPLEKRLKLIYLDA